MSGEKSILTETRDGVAVLTINRPEKMNALNRAVIAELASALRSAGEDDGVRAVVVTGAGEKAFVAGADIAEMAEMSSAQARAFANEGQALATLMDGLGKPVLAAVNGYALGGGCELALACHIRLAAPNAVFSQPEVGLGLIPGFGGTQRLARIVGEGRALEMVLTGGRVDAAEARRIGLVNQVAEEGSVVDAACAMASTIARQGPVAVGLALDAVRRGGSMPLGEALDYEAALFGLCFASEDMREGTRAFLERRKPEFRGA
jgi:enoyl-CoA hydratase